MNGGTKPARICLDFMQQGLVFCTFEVFIAKTDVQLVITESTATKGIYVTRV